MPHPRCSACRHANLADIDAALVAGESVRAVAQRFGLSYTAVHRHENHSKNELRRVNTSEVKKIDEEIRRLKLAQNRARKKRNTTELLAIARELRNWIGLRAKAEAMASAVKVQTETTMSRGEALATARALIEEEIGANGQEIIAWLLGLAERIHAEKRNAVMVLVGHDGESDGTRAAGKLPDTQV